MKQNTLHSRSGANGFLKVVYRLSLGFALAQLVLIVASWLLVAAIPDVSVRSLLSSGGVRWFFGSFARNLATPWLVWLIVSAIAWGSVSGSGWGKAIVALFRSGGTELTSQQWFALKASIALLVAEAIVVACLTLLPHALLLSVTGHLFPSSFSQAFVPVLAFMVMTSAVFYGMLGGRFHSLYDVGQSMTSAGPWLLPLLLLYVLAAEFVYSLVYVWG